MTDSEGAERSPLSPCLGICLMDPATRMCRGCLRTIDEIRGWYEASAADKRAILSFDGAVLIVIGFVVAFIAALFVVRRLVDFVSRHGFGAFAWYRIVVGAIALVALALTA